MSMFEKNAEHISQKKIAEKNESIKAPTDMDGFPKNPEKPKDPFSKIPIPRDPRLPYDWPPGNVVIKYYEFQSTYLERILRTPTDKSTERGEWSGERGESVFIPSDPEIQKICKEHGVDGVKYQDGIPDFSPFSKADVKIEGMSQNRPENFAKADAKCAEQWNREAKDGRTDWTARDVANWRRENGYTWHECNDQKTCQLIPSKVNEYFGHLGGVSECKKEQQQKEGFDE